MTDSRGIVLGASSLRPALDQVRDKAFLVYAVEAGRSLPETQRRLGALGIAVDGYLLRRWWEEDRWDERADEALLQSAGDRVRRTALHVLGAAESAAIWLDRVNKGILRPDRARLAAARLALESLSRMRSEGYLPLVDPRASILTLEEQRQIEEKFALLWAEVDVPSAALADGADDREWIEVPDDSPTHPEP